MACFSFPRWRRVLFPLLFVLALSLTLFSKSPATAQTVPTDIQNHWANGCIQSLVQRRLLAGYPDGTFRPNAPVTRAEFAALLRANFPNQPTIRTPIAFQDVPSNYWALPGIQYAYQTGFLSGYPGNQFKPTESIPRVQALGAIAGGLRQRLSQPVDTLLNQTFTDAATIPAYAKNAIAAATENGLVVSYPSPNRLNPNQVASRGEIAAFFCRATPALAGTVPAQYVARGATMPVTTPVTTPPIATPTLPSVPPSAIQSEIRAAWLTNIDSDVLFDARRLQAAVTELAQLNFNTLYPVMWNWGYTLYPSVVARNLTGATIDPRHRGLQGRDPLAELVQLGRQKGMTVLPWLEFGFMAPADSQLVARHPHWVTNRQDGTTIWQEGEHAQVWLNPFQPGVQEMLTNLAVEIITKYDVDGIQFDDHLGLPSDFGYDSYTVQLYQLEHNGVLPPSNPKDPEWLRWRADKINQFVARLFRVIKSYKPNAIVSLSPNSYKFSYENYLQDWLTWERQGYIEEMILQVYRPELASFINEISQPEVLDAQQHIPVGIGILSGLKNRPVSSVTIREQIQALRDRKFSGMSFFFYETLWNLTQEDPANRKAIFQALFPKQVTRPRLTTTA